MTECSTSAYAAYDVTMLDPENVKEFRNTANYLVNLYRAKNSDYGDSFHISIDKYGPIAGLTRISDKFNRLENLILNQESALVEDEKIKDTLLDLASYCIMLSIEPCMKQHS